MIELMVVIVVIGILATLAAYVYSRVMRKARSTEVAAMFGELRAEENAYSAEHNFYLPMCPNPAGPANADCAESDMWPTPLPGRGEAMDIVTPGLPPRWQALKVRPMKSSLYCQYVVVAGLAGTVVPAANVKGRDLYGASPVPGNWYYLVAQCDWDGDPSVNAIYWQRGDSSELAYENELR
jgi:type II secretory pathway pseudopilin PulG